MPDQARSGAGPVRWMSPQTDDGGEEMDFTRFERALLAWFLDHSSDPAVTGRLPDARLESRVHTGVGLFVHLAYPTSHPSASAVSPDSRPIPGPDFSSPSLPAGGGTVLFITDGVPDVLEVFTYGDEFPAELETFELSDPPPRTP